jgi:hypothetical protein
MNTAENIRWVATGTTDEITECDHCGRTDLKVTVHMVATTPDGENDGEMWMGTTCAARMTGRKAAEIKKEAKAADDVARWKRGQVRMAFKRAYDEWTSRYLVWADAVGFEDTAEFERLEMAWFESNPRPAIPAGWTQDPYEAYSPRDRMRVRVGNARNGLSTRRKAA